MGFKMIYCNPMSGSYLLYDSFLEKCGNFGKNGRFSGRIWPDWGNTARADMAGLGSIGLTSIWRLALGRGTHGHMVTIVKGNPAFPHVCYIQCNIPSC